MDIARLTEIALRRLHIDTLETRNSDGLDFHEVAVWSVLTALEEAYALGMEAGRLNRDAAADAPSAAA